MTGLASECRFGYVEQDGYQYCHEHSGWRRFTDPFGQRCSPWSAETEAETKREGAGT